MSRCRGCDRILTIGELLSKNKHTGDFEDLCGTCSSPEHDNGIVYSEDDPAVVLGFINETEFEHDYVCGHFETGIVEQTSSPTTPQKVHY